MNITPTPHNAAKVGDIAPVALMCGDPLRAKFIAEHFLEDAVLYNYVRGMYGYTGLWRGKKVSVQGHGMGCPSMGIYSYELYNLYGVDRIIRLGTCGAYSAETRIGEMMIASSACTDSAYGYQYGCLPGEERIASPELLALAESEALARGIRFRAGKVFSSDVFYSTPGTQDRWITPDVLAVEMEVHALYTNAAAAGKQALGLLMVSDNIATGECLSPQERERGYKDIVELALDIL